MYGTAPGHTTCRATARSDAPATRAMATSRTSAPRTPAAVLKKIRKKTMLATSATLEASPIPNQRMKSGASASFGIPYPAIRYGSMIAATAAPGAGAGQDRARHATHEKAAPRRGQGEQAVAQQLAGRDELEEPVPRHQRRRDPVRAEHEGRELPGDERGDGQDQAIAERPARAHCTNLLV